jgi:LytR cell envelope-related transcriptional attenuator
LNGCGTAGAAEIFRDFLIDNGFDIIEFGNAQGWNYPKTMVIARTEDDKVARSLAQVLNTERILHLKDPDALVEATVIVGKDHEELVRQWQKPKT